MHRRRFLALGAASVTSATIGLRCRRHAADVREVVQVVQAQPMREGAGVLVRRTLGAAALRDLDPFLLLDEIHSDRPEDWLAGFPTHPHRGFETVSYLLAGTFEHQDSSGNRGVVEAGGAQWMTAGRGVIHSEMPRQQAGLDLWGLQLWVNLPAKRKLTAPRYQELRAGDIPGLELGDAQVRLVAGRAGGRTGPIDGIAVGPTLMDATVPRGAVLAVELPADRRAFLYVLAGDVKVGEGDAFLAAGDLGVLGPGRDVRLDSGSGARLLVVAAVPIGEPIARRGPFVMNSEAELDDAVADYRAGRLLDG